MPAAAAAATPVEIRLLRAGEEHLLATRLDPDVFDDAIDTRAAQLFLADPLHHLAVAIDPESGLIIGFASAVHYFHPDKPAPELFINEVGVAGTHQGRGIGKLLLGCLFEDGRAAGCGKAWVLTERSNPAAMRLYASCGGEDAPPDVAMFTFDLTTESA